MILGFVHLRRRYIDESNKQRINYAASKHKEGFVSWTYVDFEHKCQLTILRYYHNIFVEPWFKIFEACEEEDDRDISDQSKIFLKNCIDSLLLITQKINQAF